MIDPTGFLSERDTIIGHLMQVVHLNPVYDLQLMAMFPGGLEELEGQVAAMWPAPTPADGRSPPSSRTRAITPRLLEYVRRFRDDPATPALVRQQGELRRDAVAAAAERTFATLPGFLRYCRRLPTGLGASLRRFRRTDRFPIEWAEPESA